MKVLVVDRDPAVAHRLAQELGAVGVEGAFAAGNADEAVETVNRERGIDVLATDVFLEGVDGFTLSESIRAGLPDLRTIFLTDHDLAGYADRLGDSVVLAKPVDGGALARAVFGSSVEGGRPAAPELLEGFVLGSSRIDAFLGEDLDGRFYRATQTSIGRTVELHTLAPERAADPAEVERFLASARAKANVHHAALLSVFEAGEQDGAYYYTSELRQGVSLWQIAETSAPRPSAATLLQLLRTVAEVMVHLGQVHTAHEPLHAVHVLIDARNRSRLVNIATHEALGNTAVDDMRSLAAAIRPVVIDEPASASLLRLLAEMEGGSTTVRSWTALIYEVRRYASGGTTPSTPSTYQLDPDGRAAIAAVGAARRRQRLIRRIAIAIPALLALAAAAFCGWLFLFKPIANPALEKMVRIPAGALMVPDGKVDVPAFFIDAYEVSIGQYADFLRWAERNPGKVTVLSPVEVPANHSFVPRGWADENTKEGVKPGYFSIARTGGDFDGAKLTLDSPVFGVDSFDAVCYAAWKGRRLPTEAEWERAALGPTPRKFPWGDADQPANANGAGNADHFAKWAPVDAMTADRSPFGVIGMAGNVSEWTLSAAPDQDSVGTPVVRGGNWSEGKLDIRARVTNLEPSQGSPAVGFRTAADSSTQ